MHNLLLFPWIGVQDQIQEFDTELWATCMLQESRSPPDLIPNSFKVTAAMILQDALRLTLSGVTHDNFCSVYLGLVHSIEQLVADGITICTNFFSANDDNDSD